MQFFLITLITLLATFLLNPLSKKVSRRIDPDRFTRIHIHHSVWGLLLFVAGVIASNETAMAIGLGIYLGHVLEEIYFNKRGVVRAFFILVNR